MIGFASDGCNVMMGQYNSVASRLREDFYGISIMNCVCHSLTLVANEACKELPRPPENFASSIYSFFSHSSKRQCEFVEFQMISNTEIHKMLHPSQTRWLSLTAVVDRILEQWERLKLYFDKEWVSLHTKGAESIHSRFYAPSIKLYFYFLKWVLPKIT